MSAPIVTLAAAAGSAVAPRFALWQDGRQVPLRGRQLDEALREALSLAGMRIIESASGQPLAGADISYTEFVLAQHLPLSPKRLREFARLTRPVMPETLGYLRLPVRVWTRRVAVAGKAMPLVVLIAKVLNLDDGTPRPYHEWTAEAGSREEQLLRMPPSE